MFAQKSLARWVVAAVIGGFAVLVAPAAVQAQVLVYKQCDNCKRIVPITAQVGDTCPFCGVCWGVQHTHTEYVPGGNSDDSSPRYVPTPWEREAAYQAMLRQQRRQEIWDRCEKKRQAEATEREKIYEANREKTEHFREHDDPEKRAEHTWPPPPTAKENATGRGLPPTTGLPSVPCRKQPRRPRPRKPWTG